MDLTTLRAETRTRTGVPADDSLITDAVLTQLVNAALQHISTERDWPWLEKTTTVDTVGGTATYAVPADWIRSVSVIGASGVPLRRTPIDELDYMTGSGTPRFFGIFGDQIVVRPTPSGVETLIHRYLATAPVLAADGDTPTMPAVYHHALVAFASYLLFRRTGNVTEAGAALAEYEGWLDRMRKQADRWSDSQGGGMQAEAEPVKAKA
jgi:hypothetical protein